MPPVPLPTLPNVYYGHLSMTYSGLPSGNVFTFLSSAAGPDGPTDFAYAQTIADLLCTAWNSEMIPLYPVGVSGTSSKVYPLGHPLLPAAVGSASAAGANGADVAPVSAAAVIRHAVQRRGRGSQSHSAISPLPLGGVTSDGKSVAAGAVSNLTTSFENFIAAVISGFTTAHSGITIDYVQLSKKGAGATYPILSSNCESLLGTERSRTPRP